MADGRTSTDMLQSTRGQCSSRGTSQTARTRESEFINDKMTLHIWCGFPVRHHFLCVLRSFEDSEESEEELVDTIKKLFVLEEQEDPVVISLSLAGGHSEC